MSTDSTAAYARLAEDLQGRGVDLHDLESRLRAQRIETPSGDTATPERASRSSSSPVPRATFTSVSPMLPRCTP